MIKVNTDLYPSHTTNSYIYLNNVMIKRYFGRCTYNYSIHFSDSNNIHWDLDNEYLLSYHNGMMIKCTNQINVMNHVPEKAIKKLLDKRDCSKFMGALYSWTTHGDLDTFIDIIWEELINRKTIFPRTTPEMFEKAWNNFVKDRLQYKYPNDRRNWCV